MQRFFIIWLFCISFGNLYGSEMCLALVKAGRNYCFNQNCEDNCIDARATLIEKTKSSVRTCYRNGCEFDRYIENAGRILCCMGCATCIDAHLFSIYPDNCFILNYAKLIYQSTPQEIAPALCNTAISCCLIGYAGITDCVAKKMRSTDSCLKKWAETPTKRAGDRRPVATVMEVLEYHDNFETEETA